MKVSTPAEVWVESRNGTWNSRGARSTRAGAATEVGAERAIGRAASSRDETESCMIAGWR